MVVRLWGKYQGADIINFTLDEATGHWTTIVPASESGVYTIELWAEDEAGNIGYYATVKYMFDTATLKVTVKILHVASGVSMEDVAHTLRIEVVKAGCRMNNYQTMAMPDMIKSALTRCEVC